MSKWTITRVWRDVEAPTAGDALLVPAPPGSHDSSNATRAESGLALLPLTQDELFVLSQACAASIHQFERISGLAQSETIKGVASRNITVLNSLRTACTEARWGLMTPEERAEDAVARSLADSVYEKLKGKL